MTTAVRGFHPVTVTNLSFRSHSADVREHGAGEPEELAGSFVRAVRRMLYPLGS